MGTAIAGVIIEDSTDRIDYTDLLQSLMGIELQELFSPYMGDKFDARDDSDILLAKYHNFIFIGNHSIAWDNLSPPYTKLSEHYLLFGKPSFMEYFAFYESGGSYGFSLVENGSVTRSRLQTDDDKIIEQGQQEDFEITWLNAESHLDNPPHEDSRIATIPGGSFEFVTNLTRAMVVDSIKKYFKVNFLTDDPKPIFYKYYRKQA